MRAYRQRRLTGQWGCPVWVVPEMVTLTQTIKHRDACGRLLSVEIRAALVAGVGLAGTVHVERLTGRCAIGRVPSLARRMPSPNRMPALDALIGEAVDCWGGRTSLSLPVSGNGSGADQSFLVIPRIVDDSDFYHPLKGLPPTSQELLILFQLQTSQTGPHFS